MPITEKCPKCNAVFRFPDEAAGTPQRCTKCRATVYVGLPDEIEEPKPQEPKQAKSKTASHIAEQFAKDNLKAEPKPKKVRYSESTLLNVFGALLILFGFLELVGYCFATYSYSKGVGNPPSPFLPLYGFGSIISGLLMLLLAVVRAWAEFDRQIRS